MQGVGGANADGGRSKCRGWAIRASGEEERALLGMS